MNGFFDGIFAETAFQIQFFIGLVMIVLLFYFLNIKSKIYSEYIRLGYVLTVSLIGFYLMFSSGSFFLDYAIFFPVVTGFFSILSLLICVVVRIKTKEFASLSSDFSVTIIMLLPAIFVWFKIAYSGKWFGG